MIAHAPAQPTPASGVIPKSAPIARGVHRPSGWLVGNGWRLWIIGAIEDVLVDVSGVVVVMSTKVLVVVGAGGLISGANVSLLDEVKDAHELTAKREMTTQRYMSSAFRYSGMESEHHVVCSASRRLSQRYPNIWLIQWMPLSPPFDGKSRMLQCW